MYRFYSNPQADVRVAVVGEIQDDILYIAVSRCSSKDNFIRKKGRAIAEGRLDKGKYFSSIPVEGKLSGSEFAVIAKEVADTVIEHPDKVIAGFIE